MGDGLSIEEIRGVRDRCKRMVGAAAAAGAVGTWVDARKALLATVFETHPNLDETDLDKYLVIRDLEKSEEVDPERIRELAVALFLLTRKQSLSFENVVRIAYHIFDEDGDGEMSKEEFQQLMKATLRTHLTLDFVLRLPAGKAAFLRHLKVFNLMQRDNFERFRQNPKSMEDFVNRVFTEVDRSGNGTISLEEYMEWASNNREVMRFMRGAGGQVAVIRTLPQGNDLSGLVSAGGRRTLRAIATRGIKKLRGTRVVVVRSDSTSVNSSSSSSSCPSPTQYWAGGGSDCGGNGRRRQGDNGSKGGGIAGDASGGRIGANDDRMGPATVAEAAAAGDGRASRRRHSSSATNRSGRIACSGGQGNDNGLRKEQGDRSYRGRAGGGKTGNGSEHARVIDGRGRIQPMLAFHLLGRDRIDSSHLDGLYFQQRQQEQQQEQERWQQRRLEDRVIPSYPSQKVGIVDDCDYDGSDHDHDVAEVGEEKPIPRQGEYSAEEIALRRFMTTVAWGPGLAVVKHNRGKGRGRRVLKFNDEVSLSQTGRQTDDSSD
eukprot:g16510.t1